MKRLVYICILACLCPAIISFAIISSRNSSSIENSYAREIKKIDIPASNITPSKTYTNDSYVEPFEVPVVFEDPKKQKILRELALKNQDILDIVKTSSFYPDKLLEWMISDPNPIMIEFLKSYPSATGEVTGGLTLEECSAPYPHFLQYDSRWGFYPYGETIMAKGGCGPTVLSMVAVALTGNLDATPDALAKYSVDNGYYVQGSGTAWNLFSSNITEYGIKGRIFLASYENIINALDNGHIIVLSLKPGEFTDVGHIIAIVGHKNGMLEIRDPGSISRTNRLWTYNRLFSQIKGSWEFSKIE